LLKSDKSRVIKKNLDPVWDEEGDFLVLIPLIPSSEYLRVKNLLIEVKDKDPVGNDLIGRASLKLKDKLDGEEHPFTLTLRKHGRKSGEIEGFMQVIWENKTNEEE